MLIYPAIDVIDGRCVRLSQGRFDEATYYDVPLAETLASYWEAGAKWAHLVDLDGAKAGAPRQHELLGRLANDAEINVQVAGGIRMRDDIAKLLTAGAARVVVGSRAVDAPNEVREWLEEFGPEKITLAFDIRMVDGSPLAATRGWKDTSNKKLFDLLDEFPPGMLRHILITNIHRDGELNGPDVSLYKAVLSARPDLALQASGGVRDVNDVIALATAGAAGAIIGRALYEKKIDLGEAINAGA
ncbi:MAG: 1-(5-phosphoribosyl)-5-[(5-phosphoribosylamino)methylideneamino]imidazole-4-carboxamide isomerase [Marinicaulis sp.]|nr:1-(5-phosphoribosyl)-5-[(5-phosphoribosylamino)methylideneamino]imidazole-4-carboxamide isomerase [Marinicaulis sp.]